MVFSVPAVQLDGKDIKNLLEISEKILRDEGNKFWEEKN